VISSKESTIVQKEKLPVQTWEVVNEELEQEQAEGGSLGKDALDLLERCL